MLKQKHDSYIEYMSEAIHTYGQKTTGLVGVNKHKNLSSPAVLWAELLRIALASAYI